VGLAWFALIIAPHTAYSAQLPAMVLSGVGIGLLFAPAANLVMSGVPPEDRGIASGATYSPRNVGSAFGVAVFGAVFAAHGGYGSPRSFVDGTVPALWLGVGAFALAALSALFIPAGRTGEVSTEPSGDEPERVLT
jgi:MFS family permease